MNVTQGFAIFCMQIIQGYYVDESSAYQLKIYTLGLGAIGILSCSITYFFPYKVKYVIENNRMSYGKVNLTEHMDSTVRSSEQFNNFGSIKSL